MSNMSKRVKRAALWPAHLGSELVDGVERDRRSLIPSIRVDHVVKKRLRLSPNELVPGIQLA